MYACSFHPASSMTLQKQSQKRSKRYAAFSGSQINTGKRTMIKRNWESAITHAQASFLYQFTLWNPVSPCVDFLS